MKKMCCFSLLLSACLLTACGDSGKEKTDGGKAVRVELTHVAASTGGAANRYSGTVEEESGSLLSFAVPGTVSRVLVDDGKRVGKGQLVATLETTQLQANHDAARSALTQAEDAYRRMKELHDKGSLPDIKWIEAQTTLERAQAAEKMAAKQLADCRLYAPFSGVISSKMVEVGQNVGAGMPVAKLVSTGRLKVKIAVPEGEISRIAIGQDATVSIGALGGRTIGGKVDEKGVSADPVSRSYDVKISIANADGKLMPGMVATATLSGDTASTACVIPAHVVQIDEDNNEFVWLAVNGKAHKRVITCGDFTANGVTVTNGLAAGDNIITSGQHKVCEGTRISER